MKNSKEQKRVKIGLLLPIALIVLVVCISGSTFLRKYSDTEFTRIRKTLLSIESRITEMQEKTVVVKGEESEKDAAVRQGLQEELEGLEKDLASASKPLKDIGKSSEQRDVIQSILTLISLPAMIAALVGFIQLAKKRAVISLPKKNESS